MTATTDRQPTEPLESMTVFLGALMLLALAVGAVLTLGYVGVGPVCVTQSGVQYADSGWMVPDIVKVKPGASASIQGTLQACALHSGILQRVLYVLTLLPTVVVWGIVLLLLWRMIRAARRAGPFTPVVATAMRRLGWFIIAGSVAAAFVRAVAVDQLLSATVVTPAGYVNLIVAPIRGLFPGPALAGTALLTFARIIRLGAAMDDEIKGTV